MTQPSPIIRHARRAVLRASWSPNNSQQRLRAVGIEVLTTHSVSTEVQQLWLIAVVCKLQPAACRHYLCGPHTFSYGSVSQYFSRILE